MRKRNLRNRHDVRWAVIGSRRLALGGAVAQGNPLAAPAPTPPVAAATRNEGAAVLLGGAGAPVAALAGADRVAEVAHAPLTATASPPPVAATTRNEDAAAPGGAAPSPPQAAGVHGSYAAAGVAACARGAGAVARPRRSSARAVGFYAGPSGWLSHPGRRRLRRLRRGGVLGEVRAASRGGGHLRGVLDVMSGNAH